MAAPGLGRSAAGRAAGLALLLCAAGQGTAALADAPGSEASAVAADDILADTEWRLVRIQSMDDTESVPEDPDRYTLALDADGTARLRADCNTGRGAWSSGGPGQIEFGVFATTRMQCPPGSLHDRYLAQFEWFRSYVLESGHLFLATMADGSIVEFEPTAGAPITARVLGEPLREIEDWALQAAILTPLMQEYADTHGVDAEPAEIDAYLDHMAAVARADRAERAARLAALERRLAGEDLPAAERAALESERASLTELAASLDHEESLTPGEAAEVVAMRREMAVAAIEHWELNRALHREYGGRIIFQQLGPEPLDAYREYLERRRQDGAFAIYDRALESGFWRYFTDESRHTFVTPGSEEEATAFAVPPWERGVANE